MKGKGVMNLKFNIIIVKNMVITLMSIKGQLPIWKRKLTLGCKRKIKNILHYWHIN